LLDIIEAVDGPLGWAMPPRDDDQASDVGQRLQTICDQIVATTRKQLQAVTVAELVGKKTK
jgi:hypothetical protein